MKIKWLMPILLLTLLIPVYTGVEAQTAGLEPSQLSIIGEIRNNYANISYNLVFDNTDSEVDVETSYEFRKFANIYFSNMSIKVGDLTYWGEVKTVQEAQQEYEEGVESNKTAALIEDLGDSYRLKFNIKANQLAYVSAQFEGYITRILGKYKLPLLPETHSGFNGDFSIDLNITSTISTLLSTKILGVDSHSLNSITEGRRLSYSSSGIDSSLSPVLEYTLGGLNSGDKLLTYSNGTDNFFVYFLAPEVYEDTNIVPREYIFIIDVSGSMRYDKIIQAKSAFKEMIARMGDGDLFNVIQFSDAATTLWSTSKNANATNIQDAIDFVDGLTAEGGTNINDAIIQGLGFFESDREHGQAIVFLSDGDATSGITNPDTIRRNAKDSNSGDTSIISISFGTDADENLMAGLAYDSGGEYVTILPGDEAVIELNQYYTRFEKPVATGYSISYTNVIGSVYPTLNRLKGPLFNGSEILQTGRFSSDLNITTTIRYSGTNQDRHSSIAPSADTSLPQIELIWAHNSINRILEIIFVNGETTYLRQELVSLALSYQIVVPGYTAMSLVIEDDSDTVPPSDPDAPYHTEDGDRNVNEQHTYVVDTDYKYILGMLGIFFIVYLNRWKKLNL